MTYGTQRANFYHILEESLNLRDVRIFDTKEDMQGNKIRVLNAAATQEAQMKQQQIEDAFKDWIWKDPTRRQMLVKEYNERFNSLRPREYDGSHILFHGMSPEITLRPHQKNAIAHILYGGNTLLAHVVGAGKTYEMVAAAMEKKRLGLCSKTLICVPNHLTEQLAGEALQLYPNANILVARKTDFEKANRKRFCAKIATGNYDIIIIGHSQFERIPLSQERQVEYLQSQIHDVINQVAQLKEERAENFTVKQMERMRKQLEKKLDKLNDQSRKDDVVTFEQLGVDSLMVDEAHAFGVRGDNGLGCAEEQNCINDIDFLVGTFGKAIASAGAYIACRQVIREYLINKMRTFIFTTALPPINIQWTSWILEQLPSLQEKRTHLLRISNKLKTALVDKGYNCPSVSHIVPMIVGASENTICKAEEIQRKGFYALPVRPPTVPEGTSRIRFSLTADITEHEIDQLIKLING